MSNLTQAEATWTQALPVWTDAHMRMFQFFGGVPRLLVPDDLTSDVHKASFYAPEINRPDGAMVAHYGWYAAGATGKTARQGERRGRSPIISRREQFEKIERDAPNRAARRGPGQTRKPALAYQGTTARRADSAFILPQRM